MAVTVPGFVRRDQCLETPIDGLKFDGCIRQAALLRQRWAAAGYEVKVRIVEVILNRQPILVIRTDLVNGLPRAEAERLGLI